MRSCRNERAARPRSSCSSPRSPEAGHHREAGLSNGLGHLSGKTRNQALHANSPGPVLARDRVQKFPKSGQIPGVKAAIGPDDVELRDAVKDSGLMKPRVWLLMQDIPEDLDLPLQCPKIVGREAARVLPDPDERRRDDPDRRMGHAAQGELEV